MYSYSSLVVNKLKTYKKNHSLFFLYFSLQKNLYEIFEYFFDFKQYYNALVNNIISMNLYKHIFPIVEYFLLIFNLV